MSEVSIPWMDDVPVEDLMPHEETCEDCRLVKVRCLPECGNCWGPSVHDKDHDAPAT